ncbi:hypothetical protein FOZ60_001078 [Perkinsus olseni]|uniref:Uncharacterized protein n=1 Tax=Perkinsus olseni TaxID=32597 RepID=A0A7J6MVE3_PEROL|nr:hypothetical protein FOZ60_001078 [Perkinsus olseni]
MPHRAKTDSQWREKLKTLAHSAAKLGRGEAPPKGSPWCIPVKNVLNCPYKGSPTVCTPKRNFFQKGCYSCICGFHNVEEAASSSSTSKSSNESGCPKRLKPEPGSDSSPSTSPAEDGVPESGKAKVTSRHPILLNTSELESLSVNELKEISCGWYESKDASKRGLLRLFVWAPLTGRCPYCESSHILSHKPGRTKICYNVGWPYSTQSIYARCGNTDCRKHFSTLDYRYIQSLPYAIRQKLPFCMTGGSNGSDDSIVKLLRELTVSQVERLIESTVYKTYLGARNAFRERWRAVDQGRGLGLENICELDDYPAYPRHYVPSKPHLTTILLCDYQRNRQGLRRELRQIRTFHGVSLDHQRQVVRRVDCKDLVGTAGQTACFMGDGGYVSTSSAHQIPLYPGSIEQRTKYLIADLASALYQDHPGDLERLLEVRKEAGLDGAPSKSERTRFVRTIIVGGEETAERIKRVVLKHKRNDESALDGVKRAGGPVDRLGPADIGFPLITAPWLHCLRNQLTHVLNFCVADCEQAPPFVKTRMIDFHSTGHFIQEFSSLRGTSKNEFFHSVMKKFFFASSRIGKLLYTARVSWFLMRYNRRRLASLGVSVPPEHLAPAEVEILGATEDFPGWSLASAEDPLPLIGFEYAAEVALGGDEDWLDEEDFNVVEDPLEGEHGQVTSDSYIGELLEVAESAERATVSSPAEVIGDPALWDLFGGEHLKGRSIDQLMGETFVEIGRGTQEEGPSAEKSNTLKRGRASTDSHQDSDYELFGDLSSRPSRNVAKKRRLTSAPANVGPGFNSQMESKWVDILSINSLKYSGKKLVNECLSDYQRYRVSEMRKARAESRDGECPMLFSVSYAQAEVWLKKQIQLMEKPHELGLFDENCQAREREVQAVLSHRTPSTAARLNLDVPQAKAVIPKGTVVRGPQPVDALQRSKERSGSSACVDATSQSSRYICPYCGKPLTRGKNDHVYTTRAWKYGECPEAPKDRSNRARSEAVAAKSGMKERRERAAERLRSLGLTEDGDLGRKKRCTVCGMA